MPRPLLPANDVINFIMKNQTILITGGTTGIGLATAKLLSAEGAKIIVTGRNPETLAAVQRELPGIIVIKSDSGSLSAARSLGGEVKKHVDRLDGVFLNAGIATHTPFESESPQNFDDGFNINVRGPFFQLQSLLPLLGNPSAVVFNSSLGASIAIPAESVYCATKAAVSSLGKTLAVELAPRGIRVNVVSPGMVETPILNKLGLPGEQQKNLRPKFAAKSLLKRIGTADEVAQLVRFLLSEESSYIIGTESIIDGGLRLA
jgi:NAD(P)-dependent dehydrogenase (short-subunit alcohol dehydrogenase family)